MTAESRDVLSRHLSSAAVREAADLASELLTEVVNYGTAVLSRCNHHLGPLPLKPEDRALLVLLRQVLESTDAMQILAQAGTVAASDPLLRSALEAFVAITFIAVDDRQAMQRRGRAYMLSVLRRQLRELTERKPGTPEYDRLLKKVKDDKYVSEFIPIPKTDEAEQISRIQRELATAELLAVAEIFDSFKREKKRAQWYTLDSNALTIEQLTRAVQLEGVYHVLYRSFSAYAHAQDVAVPGDEAWLRLRSSPGFTIAVSLMLWIVLEALRTVLTFYRPVEWPDMQKWYSSEVRPRRDAMQAIKIAEVPPGG